VWRWQPTITSASLASETRPTPGVPTPSYPPRESLTLRLYRYTIPYILHVSREREWEGERVNDKEGGWGGISWFLKCNAMSLTLIVEMTWWYMICNNPVFCMYVCVYMHNVVWCRTRCRTFPTKAGALCISWGRPTRAPLRPPTPRWVSKWVSDWYNVCDWLCVGICVRGDVSKWYLDHVSVFIWIDNDHIT
jgi:hypothetical protein